MRRTSPWVPWRRRSWDVQDGELYPQRRPGPDRRKRREPPGILRRGADYLRHIQEYSEPWSYLKFVKLASGEHYRVGPQARLNLCRAMGAPARRRGAEEEYRARFGPGSRHPWPPHGPVRGVPGIL